MTTDQIAPALDALGRLAIYRERREQLAHDVRAAIAAGATQAEVARISGLSRQWVARLASKTDQPERTPPA